MAYFNDAHTRIYVKSRPDEISASTAHLTFDKAVTEMLYGKPQSAITITAKTPKGQIYFKQQFAENFKYCAIGSWREPKGDQNKIDIVALKLEKNQAVVTE